MILRRWSARLRVENLEAYVRFFRGVVLPQLQALPGFVDASVATPAPRAAAGHTDVVVETRWESLESIRAFAGEDITRAVVEPEAARLLLEYDREVRHFETL